MREPDKNMRNEVLEKLRYYPDRLTAEERRVAEGDAGLRRESELNRVLDASGFGGAQAPAVGEQITAALNRDKSEAGENKGRMRSWLVGKKWYWQAAAVGAAVALVLVLAAVLPWRVSVSPEGFGVENHAAWATVDGYVLEFAVRYNTYYEGTANDTAYHPLWVARAKFDQWLESNESLAAPGSTLAELRLDCTMIDTVRRGSGPERREGYLGIFQAYIYSADRALVDDLVLALKAVPGFHDPEIYSQQWYYSSKYPETRYAGREVVINGQVLHYPLDINEDDLSLLRYMLNIWPSENGRFIYALDDTEEYRRFGLSDFIQVTWEDEGAVLIDNLPEELDFAELGLPGWVHRLNLYIPGSESHLDFDIVDLTRKNARKVSEPYTGQFPTGNFRVVTDLAPFADWYDATPNELKARFNASENAAAEQQAEKFDAALAELIMEYPQAEGCIEAEVIRIEGVPVQWAALVTAFEAEALADELVDVLGRQTDAPVRSHSLVMTKPNRQMVTFHRTISLTGIRIPLLEYADIHGQDDRLLLESKSLAERNKATEEWRAIEALAGKWQRRQLEMGVALNLNIYAQELDGVPLRGTISFAGNRELGADLVEELHRGGYSRAELNRQSPPGMLEGKVLVGWFFDPERFTGVNEKDVAAVFSADDFARARELQATVESALAGFTDRNGIGDFDSGSLHQLGLWWKEYGGLPTGYIIPSNFKEDYHFEELFTALVDAGLPHPKVVRDHDDDARDIYQEVIRRQMGAPSHDIEGNRTGNILMFYLPHSLRRNACPVESLPDTYTADEIQQAEDLVVRMKAALDGWLATAPEGLEAELEPARRWGIIQEISVICNHHDYETVRGLGESLSVDGAPVYQYGSAFFWREIGKPRMVNDTGSMTWQHFSKTKLTWSVLSQVRRAAVSRDGNYLQNLKAEFSPEELAQAEADGAAILRGYLKWLELYPEMAEPDPAAGRSNVKRSKLNEFSNEDVLTMVQVEFVEEDEERARELMDELKRLVEEEGCQSMPYLDPSMRFRRYVKQDTEEVEE